MIAESFAQKISVYLCPSVVNVSDRKRFFTPSRQVAKLKDKNLSSHKGTEAQRFHLGTLSSSSVSESADRMSAFHQKKTAVFMFRMSVYSALVSSLQAVFISSILILQFAVCSSGERLSRFLLQRTSRTERTLKTTRV